MTSPDTLSPVRGGVENNFVTFSSLFGWVSISLYSYEGCVSRDFPYFGHLCIGLPHNLENFGFDLSLGYRKGPFNSYDRCPLDPWEVPLTSRLSPVLVCGVVARIVPQE